MCNATTNLNVEKTRITAMLRLRQSTYRYCYILRLNRTKAQIPSRIYESTCRSLSVSLWRRLCLRDQSMQVYICISRTRNRHRSIARERNTSLSKNSNEHSVTLNLLTGRKSNIKINNLNTKWEKRIFLLRSSRSERRFYVSILSYLYISISLYSPIFLRSKFVNSESTNRTKRPTLLLRHRVSREETSKGFS